MFRACDTQLQEVLLCGRTLRDLNLPCGKIVIGGGDFANDRIVPDCVRAAMAKKPIVVRNPHSTRPYQHVLEPLAAYLMVAKAQV